MAKSTKPPCDYEVGYGKPPKEGQIKPGEVRNPKGRGKGTRNLKTDLHEELRETLAVREGGRTRKMSKQRALVKRYVNDALNGDKRAAGIVFPLILRLFDPADADTQAPPLGKTEEALLDLLGQRALRRKKAGPAKPDAKQESPRQTKGDDNA